jgi:drug/metabolite transporter (DMT)-like permease
VTLPPLAGALLAVAFWGLSFVATKVALRELAPVTLVFTRFAIGNALLFSLLAARRLPLLPPRPEWGAVALMGLIGVTVHQLLQSHALTMTTAVRTGWLIGLTPIWSAVLAAIFLRERPGALRVAGLAVGFAGAALVVTRGDRSASSLALPETPGDLLILASTLNWAVYTVIGRGAVVRIGGLHATSGVMLAGWLMLAPFFAAGAAGAAGGPLPAVGALARLSPAGWGAVLFLGIGCSGLAYLWWYSALERMDATRVSALLYLEPLVTLAAALAVLGEPVGWSTIAGGLLVLLGVAIVERAPRRAPASAG